MGRTVEVNTKDTTKGHRYLVTDSEKAGLEPAERPRRIVVVDPKTGQRTLFRYHATERTIDIYLSDPPGRELHIINDPPKQSNPV